MKEKSNKLKPIRLTFHAIEQCEERGCTFEEVEQAIRVCSWQPAKNNRQECKLKMMFGDFWNGNFYANKEVRPIFVNEVNEIVVITVYTYYN